MTVASLGRAAIERAESEIGMRYADQRDVAPRILSSVALDQAVSGNGERDDLDALVLQCFDFLA